MVSPLTMQEANDLCFREPLVVLEKLHYVNLKMGDGYLNSGDVVFFRGYHGPSHGCKVEDKNGCLYGEWSAQRFSVLPGPVSYEDVRRLKSGDALMALKDLVGDNGYLVVNVGEIVHFAVELEGLVFVNDKEGSPIGAWSRRGFGMLEDRMEGESPLERSRRAELDRSLKRRNLFYPPGTQLCYGVWTGNGSTGNIDGSPFSIEDKHECHHEEVDWGDGSVDRFVPESADPSEYEGVWDMEGVGYRVTWDSRGCRYTMTGIKSGIGIYYGYRDLLETIDKKGWRKVEGCHSMIVSSEYRKPPRRLVRQLKTPVDPYDMG
jgi:hypothetical protein